MGDNADERDPLDTSLADDGSALIAPHRRNRTKPKTQDGRPLRRSRRRWTVERFFAWVQHVRRVVVRDEYDGSRLCASRLYSHPAPRLLRYN